jgi:hypothetical protein
MDDDRFDQWRGAGQNETISVKEFADFRSRISDCKGLSGNGLRSEIFDLKSPSHTSLSTIDHPPDMPRVTATTRRG